MIIPEWTKAIGKAVVYGIVTTIILFAAAIALSGPSQQERRTTARNVQRLVAESHKNRETICLAVLHNPNNEARNNPRLRELCSEMGVSIDG